jgi:hypothetical protein
LNFIDQLILHSIPGLIRSRPWYFHVVVDQGRTPLFWLDLGLLVLSCLLAEIEANIVASRTKTRLWWLLGSLSNSIEAIA